MPKPDEFNSVVKGLLKQDSAADRQVAKRLLLLTGVSREWNFGPFGLAQVQQLDDRTAVQLYDRFPHLLRGPFKMNISAGWYATFPKLVDRALAAGDEGLIDFLASRLVTRPLWSHGAGKKQVDEAEKLSYHYEVLKDDAAEFCARRADAQPGAGLRGVELQPIDPHATAWRGCFSSAPASCT